MQRQLKPSARGEYEITDLNNLYVRQGDLTVERLGRGFAWLDAGTYDSLLEAAEFIRVLQRRQGQLIAAPEEIAFHQWLDRRRSAQGAGSAAEQDPIRRAAARQFALLTAQRCSCARSGTCSSGMAPL